MAIKRKNPLGLVSQRAEECVVSELLCTPQHARRMAVMMMVAIGAKCRHRSLRVNETRGAVNQGIWDGRARREGAIGGGPEALAWGRRLRQLLLAKVHAHLEIDGDAKSVIRQFLHADDFSDIFAGHGIVR